MIQILPKLFARLSKKSSIFLVILSIVLIYRLAYLDYPLLNSEAHRDYLIASHIANYHELIQTGPCCLWNGSFGEYRRTPVYHYFLASQVLIFDNVYFLSIVNLILQLMPIIVIYIITKHFFGRHAAIVATVLFSFNQATFRTALFAWEPHMMLPFLYLAYLCLFYARLKKSLRLLILALFLFLFAGSIHSSAYATAPAFFLCTFFIAKQAKASKITYFALFVIAIAFLILWQLPTITFTLQHFRAFELKTNFWVQTPINYFANFQTIVFLLIKSYFASSEKALSLLSIGLILSSLLFFVSYLKARTFKTQKRFLIYACLFIIQFLALASLFNLHAWHYYLLPIFGAFVVVIAVIVSGQEKPFFKLASFVWIVLIFFNFLTFYPLKVHPLRNQKQIEPALAAVAQKIKEIKITNGFKTANFFQVEVIATGSESAINAKLSFWVPLEKKLGTKMFYLTDSGQSYQTTNGDKNIFLVCHSLMWKIDLSSECLGSFAKSHPKHKVLEKIYQSSVFTIYLTEKV